MTADGYESHYIFFCQIFGLQEKNGLESLNPVNVVAWRDRQPTASVNQQCWKPKIRERHEIKVDTREKK